MDGLDRMKVCDSTQAHACIKLPSAYQCLVPFLDRQCDAIYPSTVSSRWPTKQPDASPLFNLHQIASQERLSRPPSRDGQRTSHSLALFAKRESKTFHLLTICRYSFFFMRVPRVMGITAHHELPDEPVTLPFDFF